MASGSHSTRTTSRYTFQEAQTRAVLISASRNGHLEVLRVLLEFGADKGLAHSIGGTALMLASEHGHLEVLRVPLESRAGKDLTRNDAWTSFMLAFDEGPY